MYKNILIMKNINPLGLFDDHFLMEKLTKQGDPLQKLNEFIDWKIFKIPLNKAFSNEDKDLSKGGRPPFDKLLMFKALIIQSLYNLSDDQLEYQIVDRASFKRFLGLKKSDKVPDMAGLITPKEFVHARQSVFQIR